MTLLLTPVSLADRVEVITPGGNASLTPPAASTEPSDAAVETFPRTTAATGSGGTTYSPAEMDTQPGLQTMHFGAASLACKVASSTTDLVVINQSPEPLPAGTRIKWQLKKEGTRGFFAIIGELGGGESLVADDVLDGQAGKDDICIARVI
ncbi:MAG: hypothetical protein EON57_17310 [Alphaproteobacteria bacterium]|nr:MAG: hypothetical protein EON57_17310 [Alphaproteobacteria bacterium]